jgi:hypothetical protein
MINRIIFLIALCSFIPIKSIGQTGSVKQAKIERVSNAYGFLTGQNCSLEIIEKKFPEFAPKVSKSRTHFNSFFGKSKERMKQYIIGKVGIVEFIKFDNGLNHRLHEYFNSQIYTEEIIENFLAEVEKRAQGEIDTPILETLLSFQYLDNPQGEFLAGFTTTYKTCGHPKAKNTDWQVKIPKSWKPEEGDRPNIIQKFTRDYGDGNQMMMLIVKELPLPENTAITEAVFNGVFSEKAIRQALPDRSKVISFTKMTFDGNSGLMMEIEQEVKRLDYTNIARLVQFAFIRGNRLYTLQGAISSVDKNTNLESDMKKYMPLFRLVANSIVVNSQYK